MRKLVASIFSLAILVSLTLNVFGQRKDEPRPIQMDDVIRMSKAGVADDIIISKLHTKIDLSVDQIIELKNAGVSDAVIRALSSEAGPKNRVSEKTTLSEVAEVGFYLTSKEGQMQPLTSAAFESQGVNLTKTIVTLGFGNSEQKASVAGASASVRTADGSPTFLFIAPEGVAATEYVLVKLEKKADRREVTVGRGNMFGGSAGFNKKYIVKFTSNKSDTRKWIIQPDKPLKPGEYAFYPAAGLQISGATVTTTGKLYEFGID